MKKRTASILVGGFVIGGLIIAVLFGVYLIQSDFWVEKATFVLNFEHSVSGLKEGAPVQFQGVRVGRVTETNVVTDTEHMKVHMPVYIQIDPRRIEWRGSEGDVEDLFHTLLDRGLRARIQVLSYITGQRMIELGLMPDAPKKLARRDLKYPEIPTVPSRMQDITSAMEDISLEEILDKLASAVKGLEQTINSPDVSQGLKGMNQFVQSASSLFNDLERDVPVVVDQLNSTLKEARGVVHSNDKRLQGLIRDLQETSSAARSSFQQLETTLDLDRGRSAQLVTDLGKTLKAARSTLRQTEAALAAIEDTAGEGSDVRSRLADTLQNVSSAARSINSLARYLQRHPESLLRGKRGR